MLYRGQVILEKKYIVNCQNRRKLKKKRKKNSQAKTQWKFKKELFCKIINE